MDPDQTAPIGAVCSVSTLFASILNLSVRFGNYLQQTTFSDAFFSWPFKGYKCVLFILTSKIECVICKLIFMPAISFICRKLDYFRIRLTL